MKRKSTVHPRADLDLAQQYLYLLERNPDAAERFKEAIRAAIKRVRSDPNYGANLNLEGFESLDLRFYRPEGFDKYLVIYQVLDDRVVVLRVLHGSQDLTKALRGG